ncbi:MAG: hypothetical protein KA132_11315 [Thauera sp.]|nr:hypothetical protein [Thauera sp.]
MLTYELLPDHEGMHLEGDYWDLSALRDLVHDVNTRSPLVEDRESDGFLFLAHEARKAYSGHREQRTGADGGERFGFDVTWPLVLVPARLMRVSLAYIDHGKRDQSVMYGFEAIIEEALREDFGNDAAVLIEEWARLGEDAAQIITELPDRSDRYLAWSPAQRAEHLVDALAPTWITAP